MILTLQAEPIIVEVMPMEWCDTCKGQRPHRTTPSDHQMGRAIFSYRTFICAACYPRIDT